MDTNIVIFIVVVFIVTRSLQSF